LLRLDGLLDGQVLRLLTHQNCGARNGKDNSKDDCSGNPEQAFWLGDLSAWRDRTLDFYLRSGHEGGAVEFGSDFRRLVRLKRFVATARDNSWPAERVPVVGLTRSDRLSWVERRHSRQTLIL
jgi:hypothetical protein